MRRDCVQNRRREAGIGRVAEDDVNAAPGTEHFGSGRRLNQPGTNQNLVRDLDGWLIDDFFKCCHDVLLEPVGRNRTTVTEVQAQNTTTVLNRLTSFSVTISACTCIASPMRECNVLHIPKQLRTLTKPRRLMVNAELPKSFNPLSTPKTDISFESLSEVKQ